MSIERLIRIIKDLLPFLTGSAGIVIMGVTHSWNAFALVVCAMLLGIPVRNNLSALMPDGEEPTPESLLPSQERLPSGRLGEQSPMPSRTTDRPDDAA